MVQYCVQQLLYAMSYSKQKMRMLIPVVSVQLSLSRLLGKVLEGPRVRIQAGGLVLQGGGGLVLRRGEGLARRRLVRQGG